MKINTKPLDGRTGRDGQGENTQVFKVAKLL
jgi:hypothetical protein